MSVREGIFVCVFWRIDVCDVVDGWDVEWWCYGGEGFGVRETRGGVVFGIEDVGVFEYGCCGCGDRWCVEECDCDFSGRVGGDGVGGERVDVVGDARMSRDDAFGRRDGGEGIYDGGVFGDW